MQPDAATLRQLIHDQVAALSDQRDELRRRAEELMEKGRATDERVQALWKIQQLPDEVFEQLVRDLGIALDAPLPKRPDEHVQEALRHA